MNRETVVLVEIDQPFCTHTYGSAPCAAALGTTGTRKCFNTRKTCQDAANYNPAPLTLTFGREQLELSRYYGFVIPSLSVVGTTPGQINLAGMDKSAAPLGQREVCSIALHDHRYSDFLVDKYRLERSTGEASSEGAPAHMLQTGAVGGYASLPDSATNSVTGDFEASGTYAPDDSTPARPDGLLYKAQSFDIRLRPDGKLQAYFSTDGASIVTAVSSVVAPFVSGAPLNWKATRATATGTVKFFTGAPLVQLGADVATTPGAIYDSLASVDVGRSGGAALKFVGGQNIGVNFPTVAGRSASQMSVEMWLTPRGTFRYFSLSSNWVTNGWLFGWQSNGRAGFGIGDAGGAQHSRSSDALLTLGVPVHLVGTYDGAVLRLYVNGVPQVLGSGFNFVTTTINTGGSVVLSNRDGSASDCSADEVRIYNRALTDAEVLDRYSAREVSSGLIAAWNFDEGSGTTVTDITGNGNTGTFVAGAAGSGGGNPAWVTPFAPTIAAHATGKIYSTEVRNGIGGSVAATFDPARLSTGWTVNGTARIVADPGAIDPEETGTFWGKWLARNPYHQGDSLRVLEGDHGDPRAELRTRHYIIDRIEGPTNGEVRITAKDRFSLIEAQRAVAPPPSEGELIANITSAATSATLNPSGVGATYPASGHVAIGDEICAYTRAGDVLTLTRAQLGTTAEDHKAEDLVQVVLSYVTTLPHNIIYDLLVKYTTLGNGTSSPFIDKPTWDARAASVIDLYTARIAEPTPVAELVGELCEQAGLSVWHDPRTNMIELRALRAADIAPTVNDRDWIIDKSLSVKRQDAKRVSEVWVYYGQRNPLGALDERQNYHSRLLDVDADAESDEQYGIPEIRRVFSRWIPQFGRAAALRASSRLLAMFRDAPLEATFRLDAQRDGELELARYFYLSTAEVQDDTGEPGVTAMACVRLGRGENEISISSQSVTFGVDEGDTGARTIYIENDGYNLNLRTIHDSLYPEATTQVITFNVLPEVLIGSTSVSEAAMRTGLWPVTVPPLKLNNSGRLQGKGATGARGGGQQTAGPGENGTKGGPALKAEHPLEVNNAAGKIYAGGGSGGGGGGGLNSLNMTQYLSGAGGGAGAGETPSPGGPVGVDYPSMPYSPPNQAPNPGATSTLDAGGAGGIGSFVNAGGGSYPKTTGDGGAGGGPGLSGASGTSSIANGYLITYGGGTGGPAGDYIQGNALVTWTAVGDVRGLVAA